MLIVLAFHHPDCNGQGGMGCIGYVAHADNMPDAVTEAFNAGVDASRKWHIKVVGPIPDDWINDDYTGRIMSDTETFNIPEPRQLRGISKAEWN
jgi:hypothetical protein